MPQSRNNYFPGSTTKNTETTNTPGGSSDGHTPEPRPRQHEGDGIMKTVTVQMDTSNKEDREDSTSTTAILPRSPGREG